MKTTTTTETETRATMTQRTYHLTYLTYRCGHPETETETESAHGTERQEEDNKSLTANCIASQKPWKERDEEELRAAFVGIRRGISSQISRISARGS